MRLFSRAWGWAGAVVVAAAVAGVVVVAAAVAGVVEEVQTKAAMPSLECWCRDQLWPKLKLKLKLTG